MIFNNINGAIINTKKINIHDDILIDLMFERKNRKLTLLLTKENRIRYHMTFINVIGFDFTACNFWGNSPHVLDFEYVDMSKRNIIPKLLKIKESTLCDPTCVLETQKDFIETKMTFTSGDKLEIACEYIEI